MSENSDEDISEILELIAALELSEQQLPQQATPYTAAAPPAAEAEPEGEPAVASRGYSLTAQALVDPVININVNVTQSAGGAGGPSSSTGSAPPAASAAAGSTSWDNCASRSRQSGPRERAAAAGYQPRAPAGPEAAAPSSPAGPAPPLSPPPSVCAERLDRAALAGKYAGQKASGVIRAVPKTPALAREGPKTVFVVIRARPPLGAQGIYYGDFHGIAGYVVNESGVGLDPRAIFHGFTTAAEALEYWRAATGGATPVTLPERRI